jgi:hypothetical protein
LVNVSCILEKKVDYVAGVDCGIFLSSSSHLMCSPSLIFPYVFSIWMIRPMLKLGY